MGILFGATGYAGYLGWQWRRTRTIGDDIKALKAMLPKPAAGETEAPAAPAALTQQITALEQASCGGQHPLWCGGQPVIMRFEWPDLQLLSVTGIETLPLGVCLVSGAHVAMYPPVMFGAPFGAWGHAESLASGSTYSLIIPSALRCLTAIRPMQPAD